MSVVLHGEQIKVYMNGSVVALSKSCDIEVSCDTEEVASPTTADWRDFIAGRKDWTINVSVLLSSVSTLVSAVGSTVTLTFGTQPDQLQGQAIVQATKITATRGNLAQGSWKFRGKGALTQVII
jgi:predicted secreted protein